MEYYQKYIKYKTKYINLKKHNLIGGNNDDKPLEITVKQPWFDFIANGRKTIEGRLDRGIFSKIKLNDRITWINKKNKRLKCTM